MVRRSHALKLMKERKIKVEDVKTHQLEFMEQGSSRDRSVDVISRSMYIKEEKCSSDEEQSEINEQLKDEKDDVFHPKKNDYELNQVYITLEELSPFEDSDDEDHDTFKGNELNHSFYDTCPIHKTGFQNVRNLENNHRMHRFREKLKKDPEKWEAYKKKGLEIGKLRRLKIKEYLKHNPELQQEARKKQTERMRAYRARKKLLASSCQCASANWDLTMFSIL